MDATTEAKTFGPVPSRRLGRSLGVNNIPPKICSYSCIYCQLGCTLKLQAERTKFYAPEEIVKEVKEKIKALKLKGEHIDYISFVPDGEPTLDIQLGEEIKLLKPLGIKIAVITNASLISREDVLNELSHADWVSLKVDAVNERTWRKINRPHKSLKLNEILDGMLKFRDIFKGELTTETMLVKNVNDGENELQDIGKFLGELAPSKAYISIPIRPPAFNWVQPAQEEALNNAYQIFSENVGAVEFITGYEGNAFSLTGDIEADILSITSVHPMREESVREFLNRANVGWDIVEKLVNNGELLKLTYGGKKFYMRKLPTLRR
ncbi:MAG: radical SAM protein [Candidatus Odinarchaeia archaeon]